MNNYDNCCCLEYESQCKCATHVYKGLHDLLPTMRVYSTFISLQVSKVSQIIKLQILVAWVRVKNKPQIQSENLAFVYYMQYTI